MWLFRIHSIKESPTILFPTNDIAAVWSIIRANFGAVYDNGDKFIPVNQITLIEMVIGE